MDKTENNKRATNSLLEKSKALREKSKETEAKLSELKAQVNEFMHPDKVKSEQQNKG